MRKDQELLKAMAENPHIMTFSDMGESALKGMSDNKLSGAGWSVCGAILEVSKEASKRSINAADDLLKTIKQQKPKTKTKPK